MKTLKSLANKHFSRNPHKNTLETKTIRKKSWQDTLDRKHIPAVILLVAGFFIALIPTAKAMVNDNSRTNTEAHNNAELDIENESDIKSTEDSLNENRDSSVNQEQSRFSSELNSSGSSHTNIELKSETKTENNKSVNDTSVTVDGQKVNIDDNGRIKHEIETENSRVKIKGKVDTDSGSNNTNIRIDTDVNNELP